MSRWSPSVLPEAPRFARPIDIGGALSTLADGVDDVRERRRLAERQQIEDDRYADRENQARIDRYKAEERQTALDKLAAEDRALAREDRYLTTRGRAADQGFVPEGDRARRRTAAAGLQGGGGEYGAMFDGIGSALLAATEDAPTTTLTRPDGAKESLVFDPTQTKSVREEMAARNRDRWEQSLRPAPRDPVADHLREHEGKLKLDKQYGAGDFRPRERSGGGSGSATAGLSIADKMFDNADRVVARVERMEPKPPDYSKWAGGDRPDPEYAPPAQVAAYKADSTARAGAYEQRRGAWQNKLGEATRMAQQWMSIGDALARESVGASGGDAILSSQQINAQREIQQLSAEFARDLAEIRQLGDKQGEQELQQQYTRDVQLINQKYGIRPRAED